MKFINIKGFNFFILVLWLEIIIFSISLFGGNIISNIIFYILEITLKKDFYSMSFSIVNSVKLAIMFAIVSYIQSVFVNFLLKWIRNHLSLMVYIINACFISSFFMDKILSKTLLKDYKFLWMGFLLAFILGNYELFLRNRHFFAFSFKKEKKT